LKQRIWFNHWFNSAYHFIKLIRNNPDGTLYEVFGTNRYAGSAVLQACDHREIEPDLPESAYLDFCLDFCRKNRIDVFVPRHGLFEIAAHIDAFEKIGTRVLTGSDVKLLQLTSDKGRLYDSCKEHQIIQLPKYYIVNTIEQLVAAHDELADSGCRVCFKPVNGEGASGFRVIDKNADTIQNLFSPISHRVSLDQVCRILSSQDQFSSLMVMEYLDGYEYSIDCLAYNGQLLATVPRKKVDARIRILEENQELIKISQRFFQLYKLPYIFNIQVRYSGGVPKLLEINPRMSGGLHISCLSGINFPYLAVKLLTTGKAEVPVPKFDISAYQIEQTVILKNL
jgi:biotin carboxylase